MKYEIYVTLLEPLELSRDLPLAELARDPLLLELARDEARDPDRDRDRPEPDLIIDKN